MDGFYVPSCLPLERVMHCHCGEATLAVWHTYPRPVRPVRWRAKPLRVMSVMTPGLWWLCVRRPRRWSAGTPGPHVFVAWRHHSLGSPCFGGLRHLTVDAARTGLTRSATGLPQVATQRVVHPLPDACTVPGPKIMVDRLVGRKVRREHAPLAPAPPHVGGARATTGLGRVVTSLALHLRCQEGQSYHADYWVVLKANPQRGSNSMRRKPSSVGTWPRASTSWRLPN
jgi:hypothetical protein